MGGSSQRKRKKLEGQPRCRDRVSPFSRLSVPAGLPTIWESVPSQPLSSTTAIPISPRHLESTSYMGIMPSLPSTDSTPCYVMSDTWPGWLHVLPSFSFICRHLFTSHASNPWVAQLVASHPGCCVTSLTPHMRFPVLDPSITFGFI